MGFLAYGMVCGYCALRLETSVSTETRPQSADGKTRDDSALIKPAIGTYLLWLSLAACASVMFLATTNQICQDVAAVPFLWVLPLSIYLLSFILCFRGPRWYPRTVYHPAIAMAIFPACLVLNGWAMGNFVLQIVVYLFTLFVACMICHGELARSTPGARYLTSFYLMVARAVPSAARLWH